MQADDSGMTKYDTYYDLQPCPRHATRPPRRCLRRTPPHPPTHRPTGPDFPQGPDCRHLSCILQPRQMQNPHKKNVKSSGKKFIHLSWMTRRQNRWQGWKLSEIIGPWPHLSSTTSSGATSSLTAAAGLAGAPAATRSLQNFSQKKKLEPKRREKKNNC